MKFRSIVKVLIHTTLNLCFLVFLLTHAHANSEDVSLKQEPILSVFPKQMDASVMDVVKISIDTTPPHHVSVQKSLKSMGLVEDHLGVWISAHPTSALRHLKHMPSALQVRVANLATFVRKENPKLDPKTSWRVATALVHYSNKYRVPVPLAVGVAHVESRFQPNSESRKGALGVMQVRWSVHHGLLIANGITHRDQMFDPEKGVAAGCLLLSRYIKAYGSVQSAMNRYYGGSAFAYMRKVNKNIAKLVNHENKGSSVN